jgi:hypothetical protein
MQPGKSLWPFSEETNLRDLSFECFYLETEQVNRKHIDRESKIILYLCVCVVPLTETGNNGTEILHLCPIFITGNDL